MGAVTRASKSTVSSPSGNGKAIVTTPPLSAGAATASPRMPAASDARTSATAAPSRKAAPDAPETFTVTREQMEKMEGLAGQLAELNDQHLRLMAEYAVTNQETRDEEAVLYTLPLAEKKRFFYYEKVFATIITKLSGAFILREKRKENTVLSAYGTVDQVEFAYETYIFLQDAMNEAYRNASKAYQGETEKLSFAAGLASRLLEKVERESDTGVSKALILSTKSNRGNREAFLKIHSELRIRGKRSLSNFSSRSSFEAGENAAMAIRLPKEKGRIRKIGLKGGC